MADSVLRDKSKEFAKQIVLLCRAIKQEHRESVLTNQLLRSGTSIGANIHEAQYAQGTKDFISKFEYPLKKYMKQSIGLNCCLKPDMWMNKHTNLSKTTVERSGVCLFQLLEL